MNLATLNPRFLLSASSLVALMGSYLFLSIPAKNETALITIPSRAMETLTQVVTAMRPVHHTQTSTRTQIVTFSAPIQTVTLTEVAPTVTTTTTVPIKYTVTFVKPPTTITEKHTVPAPFTAATTLPSSLTPITLIQISTVIHFSTITQIKTSAGPTVTHSVSDFLPRQRSLPSRGSIGEVCICSIKGVIGMVEMVPESLVKAYHGEPEEEEEKEES